MCLQKYLSFHLAYNYNFVCISTQKVKSKRIKLYLHTTLSILHSEFPSLFVCNHFAQKEKRKLKIETKSLRKYKLFEEKIAV